MQLSFSRSKVSLGQVLFAAGFIVLIGLKFAVYVSRESFGFSEGPPYLHTIRLSAFSIMMLGFGLRYLSPAKLSRLKRPTAPDKDYFAEGLTVLALMIAFLDMTVAPGLMAWDNPLGSPLVSAFALLLLAGYLLRRIEDQTYQRYQPLFKWLIISLGTLALGLIGYAMFTLL